jgi:5'-3' exonuclease
MTIFGEDSWLSAIINLVTCLRRNHIHSCFIYDTSAPEEKKKERDERKEKREKLDRKIFDLEMALEKAKNTGEIDQILKDLMSNSSSTSKKSLLLGKEIEKKYSIRDIDYEVERIKKQSVKFNSTTLALSKELFDTLGIPYFQAHMEAETTCADLCKRGIVDYVISEDTDVLAYGAPFLITKINTSENTCVIVEYESILKALEFTPEQFLDFCIMCGTDYNKNINKVGPKKAYQLMKEFESIDNLDTKVYDISILNHKRSRELFRDYKRFEESVPYCKPPNFEKLGKFLFVNNIRYSIEKIKKDFTEQEFVIVEDEGDEDGE